MAIAGTTSWSAADDRRLRALMLAMMPYPKILAEFPGHSANVVRQAFEHLFVDETLPLDMALIVLGDRAEKRRACATGLLLDGRVASPAQIVGAANLVLRGRGSREIAYLGSASA